MHTNVFLLPELIDSDTIDESCCVIIDVLRATTTIVTAFTNGARSVIPCHSIEQATEIAKQQQVLRGGERNCVKPETFDLGNSPAEYSSDVVQDMDIAFTTTNGTKAMLACAKADKLLLAAFRTCRPSHPALHKTQPSISSAPVPTVKSLSKTFYWPVRLPILAQNNRWRALTTKQR